MNGVAFREMVEADPDLELTRVIEGATPTHNFGEGQCMPLGGGHQLPLPEILRAPRDELLALLRFEREGQIMRHINGPAAKGGRPVSARSGIPLLIAA